MIKKGDTLELVITDLAFGGQGIAKQDNLVIFIDKALPGQTVQVEIKKLKKNYAEAKLIELVKRSSDELTLDYQATPGAPWATLPIEIQQEYKQKQVTALFAKFAKVDVAPIFDEYIESPRTWEYRNKMEYSFGPTTETKVGDEWEHEGFGLGSKKRGQYWLVENLEKPSGIFSVEFEQNLPKIREFLIATGKEVFNQRAINGFFRHLVVRRSFAEDKYLVNLVTTVDKDFDIKAVADFFKELFGEKIGGFLWSQTDSTSDSTTNYEARKVIFGAERLEEKINDLSFAISLDSFFQTNPAAAEKLYEKVTAYAELKPKERALDLFCGTGTIAQVLASKAKEAQILGVEIVPSAVEDAKRNALGNNLRGITFICADVRKFLKDVYPKNAGTIILDPPRAGIVPKSLQRVLEFSAEKIIYVSCNPSTMARDTVEILAAGYKLEKLSLADQFPHTSHVECVGKFIRMSV